MTNGKILIEILSFMSVSKSTNDSVPKAKPMKANELIIITSSQIMGDFR
jgi:hypothetical protein